MEARAKTVGALERAGPLTEEHAKAGKENIWPGRDSENVKTGGRCIKQGRREGGGGGGGVWKPPGGLATIGEGHSGEVACENMTPTFIRDIEDYKAVPLTSHAVTCGDMKVRNRGETTGDASRAGRGRGSDSVWSASSTREF